MCGIVGYFNIDLATEQRLPLLRQMGHQIRHRGPDDDGYYTDDLVGLGMKRLSIIDVAGGHQPITNETKSMQIIFNGEIYNYRVLREMLIKQGHTFATASDTEVILHQYEQDGAASLHRFNGMFAIAIWNKEDKTLFLARDRMGIKPLYYFWDGRRFLFASEIKSLFIYPYISRTLNLHALWDYLTFRYIPQPETIWQHIYKLLPGHYLTISSAKPTPAITRYWDIPYTDDISIESNDDYLHEFEHLFLDAVRHRLIADVPVGIFLSGGLDSSAVTAAVSEVHNARLNSFSVSFKDSPSTNELPYALEMANFLGTQHHEITIDETDFMDFLPSLVRHTDEPLADLASVPLYYVAKLAREHVKVVLSGEGSDEILGGYDFASKVSIANKIRLYQRLPEWLRRNCFMKLMRLLGEPLGDFAHWINEPVEHLFTRKWVNMTNYLSSSEKAALIKEQTEFKDSMLIVQSEAEKIQSNDHLHRMLYSYCQSWLVEDLLMKADKMTMANSLELRVPFLDHRLVEWATRTPSFIKIGREQRRYQSKWILRKFAANRLPKKIINRPKQGFPVPVYDWLPLQLKPWAMELLGSADTHLYNWLKASEVQKQLLLGTESNSTILDRHRLWNLLILELWMREWKPT